MQSIRRFSSFLVTYAQSRSPAMNFADEQRRTQRVRSLAAHGSKVSDCKCPVCGKGDVLESQRSFFCSRMEQGCHFTLWKDCLTRGGGPQLTTAITTLLLKKKEVRGSTGTITMNDQVVAFFPGGSAQASAVRPLIYEKKA